MEKRTSEQTYSTFCDDSGAKEMKFHSIKWGATLVSVIYENQTFPEESVFLQLSCFFLGHQRLQVASPAMDLAGEDRPLQAARLHLNGSGSSDRCSDLGFTNRKEVNAGMSCSEQ